MSPPAPPATGARPQSATRGATEPSAGTNPWPRQSDRLAPRPTRPAVAVRSRAPAWPPRAPLRRTGGSTRSWIDRLLSRLFLFARTPVPFEDLLSQPDALRRHLHELVVVDELDG